MTEHVFIPAVCNRGRVVEPYWNGEEIHDEPMLYRASWGFAREMGGDITQIILDGLEKSPHVSAARAGERLLAIDTRSHMLMKDMWPAIPGWHCDGLVRRLTHSQPELDSYSSDVRHFACFVASRPRVSRTQYLSSPVTLDVDAARVWGSVDSEMARRFGDRVTDQEEGDLLSFDENTLHRAMPCVEPGWRFFFRLTIGRWKPANRIRRQVQVYTTPGVGW